MEKRQNFTPEEKAKIVIEVLKEEKASVHFYNHMQ
jgi:transposase-like protein